MAKRWSVEEEEFLKEWFGKIKIKSIAADLNRSPAAIISKKNKMNLGSSKECREELTANELAEVCNVAHATVVRTWIKKKGLKATEKIIFRKQKYYLIKISDFWNWAEKNKENINFYFIEKNILGKEPKWVNERRKIGRANAKRFKKWTNKEDEILKMLLRKETYEEIGERLGRSKGSVKARVKFLGLTRLRIEWEDKEIKLLRELNVKGLKAKEISNILARSQGNVYSKLKIIGG
ncbi:hypothetical protein [Clostridium sp.]|uniref:hypothetical protein n=1 Tax=Clostridium sp. TaxID=1506 RepID=UPI0026191E19|nr:hypothetical protein [Clostridium sp.]